MTNDQITVTQHIKFVNKTTEYGVSEGIALPLSDEEFERRANRIPGGIQRWWNARPYRMRIRDRTCDERIYRIYFNPVRVTSGQHYTIDLYNVPVRFLVGTSNVHYYRNGDTDVELPASAPVPHPGWPSSAPLGASFVKYTTPYGSWNLADSRTSTDTDPRGRTPMHNILEPHEYGHMLGIKDAYRDADSNGLLFHTRGDLGSSADDYRATSSDGEAYPGVMGTMRSSENYPKGYALTVAHVVITQMNGAWGHSVEDWEILV